MHIKFVLHEIYIVEKHLHFVLTCYMNYDLLHITERLEKGSPYDQQK